MTVETLGRAVAMYRRAATTRSAIVLLIANAIPLVGVLFFGWSLLTILVLYWIENGIVGFWNVPKIALAGGSAAGRPLAVGRLGLALFFAVHYGVFWRIHGIFVFALPEFGSGFDLGGDNDAFGEVIWPNVLLAAGVLFLSHGASFLFNYVGRGEYITASAAAQMMSPYGRVVVLHLTIIFGAMVVAFLGAPIGALVILIGLKTAFDLGLHLREHRNSGPPLPGGVPGAG